MVRLRTVAVAALAGLVAAAALAVSATASQLDTPPPPPPGSPGGLALSLDVKEMNPEARTVGGILHCVPPEMAGKFMTFAVAPHVEFAKFAVGQMVGAMVDTSTNPPTIVGVGPTDCTVSGSGGPGPSGPGPGPGPYGPGPDGPGKPAEYGPYGPGPGQGGPEGPPPGFFKKTFKMDVTLEDAEGLLFDVSLNKLLKGVPKMMREYINAEIEGETFEVDASKAKCFLTEDGKSSKVACTKLAALVGDSAEGVHAVVLGKPVKPATAEEDPASEEAEEGEIMSFTAKKVVVYT